MQNLHFSLPFWDVFHPYIGCVTHFWGRLTTNSCYSQLPESNFTPETVKIAMNVICLTKKTEEKLDDRERSYDFMNAGIRKRKIGPFRDASALMGYFLNIRRHAMWTYWKTTSVSSKSNVVKFICVCIHTQREPAAWFRRAA